ncbi:hypothetical protein P692DRAFT_201726212 [Suillus brevipes Sb2]|nr:hypothetical protein P692DRAFT_201726212 [Suillus brevipes Sb2]
MVNRRISKDLKECALRLWDHGWELKDICEAFGVSRRSCYRWQQIFEEHGAVEKPPSPLIGRTRTITRALLMAIQDLFSEESDLYLDEVCTWLAFEHDIIISPSALSRNLEQAVLQKLAIERDEACRQEFKDSLQNHFIGDGSEFVVLNETSKNEHTYARLYGRAARGKRAMLTDLPHMILFPAERSVLVLDNCHIHHNEVLIELVESAGLILCCFLITSLTSP